MNAQLAAIQGEFVSARDRLHRLVRSTPLERWDRRPRAESWSAAECVAHLNLTGAAYVPLLRAALRGGEGRTGGSGRSSGPYRRDTMGFLLSATLGPLPGIGGFRVGRMKTTAAFVPGSALDQGFLVSEFDRLQSEQIAIVREADGLPLNDLRIVSPFDARVTYNVWSAFVILPRHQHRHLAQAERAVG